MNVFLKMSNYLFKHFRIYIFKYYKHLTKQIILHVCVYGFIVPEHACIFKFLFPVCWNDNLARLLTCPLPRACRDWLQLTATLITGYLPKDWLFLLQCPRELCVGSVALMASGRERTAGRCGGTWPSVRRKKRSHHRRYGNQNVSSSRVNLLQL